ncbi:hypothetical protein CK203_031627 [Vitis vinifera]|uniref:Uncharacterized protein n=1 Tax=Vitis vinifera TaxID=29760 RepID=A0A438IFU9_VITVI|nr:hypothetical protein CK203_031627 [Vitis vinifera]
MKVQADQQPETKMKTKTVTRTLEKQELGLRRNLKCLLSVFVDRARVRTVIRSLRSFLPAQRSVLMFALPVKLQNACLAVLFYL